MVVLTLASSTAALKCWDCKNCAEQKATESACSPLFDVCMTTTIGDDVLKGCGINETCTPDLSDASEVTVIECCSSDYCNMVEDANIAMTECHNNSTDCNTASSKMINRLLILVLPFTLYILRC